MAHSPRSVKLGTMKVLSTESKDRQRGLSARLDAVVDNRIACFFSSLIVDAGPVGPQCALSRTMIVSGSPSQVYKLAAINADEEKSSSVT